ncbi:hypothetical protein CR513_07964, partial [Mucuna pruriens]
MEVFAPVARLDTVRVLLALAAQCGWEVFQLDVKSAFFTVSSKKKYLYNSRKDLSKKEKKIKSTILRKHYTTLNKHRELKTAKLRRILQRKISKEFDMSNLGRMRHFLGIEVIQSDAGIFICQRRYAREVLVRFNMTDSNPVRNPIVLGTILSKDEDGVEVDATKFKQAVGSLMYLTVTRPDLMFGVSLISRFMTNPKESHWATTKRLLRYLKGTTEHGIFYKTKGRKIGLIAYTDSNYARDLDDRRSTSGLMFMMGYGAVSRASKKQPVVSLSTTEAKYIVATLCACQCIWLRRILEQLGAKEKDEIVILCDNSSAIQLSINPVFHGRSKHITVRFHFLRDLVNDKVVRLSFCCSEEQVADIMTKSLKLE